jgi:RNA polymerase sigma factor (sigma-70 family)
VKLKKSVILQPQDDSEMSQELGSFDALLLTANRIQEAYRAESELVDRFTPLLKSKIGQWFATLPPDLYDDVLQEAVIALLEAIRSKDCENGVRFEHFLNLRLFTHLVRFVEKERKQAAHEPLPDGCEQGRHDAPVFDDAVLSCLEANERRVIVLRFGLDGGKPHTLSEIGEHLGVSKERARQIEARALERLRDRMEEAPV